MHTRATRGTVMGAAVLAAVVGSATGCSNQGRVKAETAVAKALISDADEEKLGEQVHQELEKQGIKYLNDPVITEQVNQLAGKILPFASKDRPNVKWHVHVVDDPKMVNAFATPGGHLYVFTGLLLAADNQAELAGVLAHEAGHVVGRHSARQMVTALGLQTVATLALGENPGMLANLAAQIAGQGTMLAHSRSDEYEADQYGVRYASAAGYDPHGIGTFFTKLKGKEGKTPMVMKWLSTHPAPEDRVARVNKTIRDRRLGGSYLGAEQMPGIKQRVIASGGPSSPAPTSAPAARPPAPAGAPAPAGPPAPAPGPPAPAPAPAHRHAP